MKKRLLLFLLLAVILSFNITAQSVGINTDGSVPDASAMLDVKSSDKGILIPRTDTATVNAAGTPASGLMIYNPIDGEFYLYNGTKWTSLNRELKDKDHDTGIDVELVGDEDKIRFRVEGTEALRIEKNGNGEVVFNGGDLTKGNLFFGVSAGQSNNGNGGNTAFGHNVMRENTSGTANTAMGSFAFTDNTTGLNNTAVGWASMQFNISGNANTAYGMGALRENSSGHNNTAVGLNALTDNKSGFNSVAVGFRAGIFDTVSVENVYIGTNAGAGGNVTADAHQKSENVMIGFNSGEQSQGSSNVFLGNESGRNEMGDHKLIIENSDADSTEALIYGEFDNDLIRLNGKVFMRDGWTDGDMDTKIEVEKSADDDKIRMSVAGEEALVVQENDGGLLINNTAFNKRNVFLGYFAGYNTGKDSTFVNSGHLNTGMGFLALAANTNGLSNTAVGSYALNLNTTGISNTAVGDRALGFNLSGSNNAAFGVGSLDANTTGYDNTAMGLNALGNNKTGYSSVAMGRRSGVFDTTSVRNVYLGTNAGAGGTTTADKHQKSNNVMIGYDSGQQAQGSNNVFLGYESGKNETGNNKLYIANSEGSSSDALIYGEFDNKILGINGKLGVATTGAPSDALHVVGTGSDDLFRVQLAGSTKMRIFNNGSISLGNNNTNISSGDVYVHNDLGIGAGTPSNRLHVLGNGDGVFMAKIENQNTGSKSAGLIIEIGSTVNPGTSNAFIAFQDQDGTSVGSVVGDGSGGVQYNTISDRRLKQNIHPFTSGLSTIDKMMAHSYEMKSNPGVEHIGFIAQELFEVLPNIVKGTPETTDKENPMMVDYGKVTPVLLAAVKELKEKNEALTLEVDQLKAANASIVAMQAELEEQRGMMTMLMSALQEKKDIQDAGEAIGKK